MAIAMGTYYLVMSLPKQDFRHSFTCVEAIVTKPCYFAVTSNLQMSVHKERLYLTAQTLLLSSKVTWYFCTGVLSVSV